MYFPDLAVYLFDCYLGVDNPIPYPNVRTIGWLERGHSYSRGDVDNSTIEKLKQLLGKSECLLIYRGFHSCDLCESSEPRPQYSNAVLWIPANVGFFVTPSLIIHYIVGHGYCPPKEFTEAVHAFNPDSTWNIVKVVHKLCNEARNAYRQFDAG